MTLVQVNNMMRPDQMILIEGIPSYEEMMEKGVGASFHDPQAAPKDRVYYD